MADFGTLGQEIVQIVRQNFYDPKRASEWAAHHENYAAGVADRAIFTERTNALLQKLNTSHTGYYTPRDTTYFALLAIFQRPLGIAAVWHDSIGADFVRLPQGFFVRRVFAQSPAEKAGVLRGDNVLTADGGRFDPALAFQDKAGQGVILTIKRRQNEAAFAVRVTPRRVQPRAEWLEAQQASSRVIARNNEQIAYVSFFTGTGGEYLQAVQDAIVDKFQNAQALVLDFRDGFGGARPEFVNLFNPSVPQLTYRDRDGKRQVVGIRWHKPLYVLVNGGTRSGKEAVAFAIKKHHIGTLIGERTAGAVMAGRAFLLSDQSLLYLAVADVLVDGERLEGRGVEPNVVVKDALPYAAGKDVQLEKALSLVAAGTR